MGSMLTLEQLAQQFTGMFTRRVFRLESLDFYDAPNEREPYASFLAGGQVDPSWRQPWQRLVRGVVASGRRMSRVHVVTEPVSEYVRFSLLHGYPASVQAGEEVRILGRGTARAAGLPGLDFWLFDDDVAALLAYDDAGSVIQVLLDDDPPHVARYCVWRDQALSLSAPLADYAVGHGISQERMRQ